MNCLFNNGCGRCFCRSKCCRREKCNCRPQCPPCEQNRCSTEGNLIINGDFESWFSQDSPTDWSHTGNGITSGVFRNYLPENVLSGAYSAGIKNATLSQVVPIKAGCFYRLSFSARTNSITSLLIAAVIFITAEGEEINATEIFIAGESLPTIEGVFNYYSRVTERTPVDAVAARISFTAATSSLSRYVFLDNVSFSGVS